MKKLYKKSTVHPTPSAVSEHLLSFLPAAILALTAALSPADKEVLAYLISCSSGSQGRATAAPAKGGGGDCHNPCFNCSCFRCYTSYWAKWDASPNRQLIHEVIDAFEEKESKKEKSKKERRKGKTVKSGVSIEPKISEPSLTAVEFESNAAADGRGEEEEVVATAEEFDKGSSVRRFVSWAWGVWG
ncbi:hypothetical protein SASPL_144699 [Salvia splendens]|uniref:Uncharacterized protein n=1 Tax=Salvia splendens TaxID=180675 RepID=A0A8X8WG80_SALSN|nr:uncharacterized protein LOC121775484 [Salvia splendens]KAG6394120.1 hypothetical protein SASPL_144699 [Salvia splendens]